MRGVALMSDVLACICITANVNSFAYVRVGLREARTFEQKLRRGMALLRSIFVSEIFLAKDIHQ
jgi:hypothetical protein